MSSKIALITGGAKNIGASIVKFLAQYGYDVIIHYNNSEKEALTLKKQIKAKSTLVKADLTNIEEAKNLSKEITNNFPNCSLLINNASIFDKSQFIEDDDLNNLNMNIHYHAPMILTKAIYQNCQKSQQFGNIINIIDKNIIRNSTKYFYYLLSKKMLAEFTKLSATGLAPLLRINGICPGLIDKDHSICHSQQELNHISQNTPLKRAGRQEEIIQTIEFILNNKFITGQNIFVDGGASLNNIG